MSVMLNCLFLLSATCPGGFPAAVTGTHERRWVVAPDDSHDISTQGSCRTASIGDGKQCRLVVAFRAAHITGRFGELTSYVTNLLDRYKGRGDEAMMARND